MGLSSGCALDSTFDFGGALDAALVFVGALDSAVDFGGALDMRGALGGLFCTGIPSVGASDCLSALDFIVGLPHLGCDRSASLIVGCQ